MRLFTALVPPRPVLDAVEAAEAGLPAAAAPLRWTGRADRHLTLAFLGEVPDPDVAGLGAALAAEAARHAPLRLALRGGGTFPADAARAAVLWADVAGDTDALTALADGLRGAARAAGVPVEDRRYVPHLTLARCRPPADLRPLRDGLAGFASPAWTAAEVALVHSRLDAVPRYRTAATWRLG
jgi:2'-5' RNA ligase